MNVKINEYCLDGGYDSFENHADIWYKLKAKPLISLPIDAVINEEGEVERLGHWANNVETWGFKTFQSSLLDFCRLLTKFFKIIDDIFFKCPDGSSK